MSPSVFNALKNPHFKSLYRTGLRALSPRKWAKTRENSVNLNNGYEHDKRYQHPSILRLALSKHCRDSRLTEQTVNLTMQSLGLRCGFFSIILLEQV